MDSTRTTQVERFVPPAIVVILLAGAAALFIAGADVKERPPTRPAPPVPPVHRAPPKPIERVVPISEQKFASAQTPVPPAVAPPRSLDVNASAAITRAAVAGNTNELARLLAAQPDLLRDTNSAFRSTPLHFAAYNRQPEAVRFLLDRGADANAVNARGTTPLHDAVASGNRRSVELLLQTRADPLRPDKAGKSPLDLAVSGQRDDLAELLRARAATKGQASFE